MSIESLKNQRSLFGQQHATLQGKGLKLGLLKQNQKDHDEGLNVGKVTNKALYRELLARLNEAVGYTGEQHIESLEPSDYTPEAVAERILGVVDGAMKLARLNGGDDAAEEKLRQARKGIEQGFNEARKMLQGMGAFEGLAAENANKTWDLLQAGLDEMEADVSATDSVNRETLAVQSSQRESMELSLTTRDGDKVHLRMASSESALHYREENTSGSVQVDAWQRSEHLYLSVEGELDDEERAAINQLIDESRTLADKLFSGDAQAAFNHLLEQGNKSSDIVSYALRVSQQRSQLATYAYQSVNEINEGKSEETYPKTLIKPIQDYLQEVGNSLSRLVSNPVIAQPGQALADGVEKLSKLDEKTRGLANALEHRSGQSLSALHRNLMELMEQQQQRFADHKAFLEG
ncbi:MAG: DUF5610 domain-containing protein [Gammaproteobacteria bacterium]|nr:DUF5610 domain-containing protein [Gammaproteobacteria bacterium]